MGWQDREKEARSFLECLDPEALEFTFQTFDDRGKDEFLAKILHGSLADRSLELEKLNTRAAGIHVTINRTDLNGRSRENILAARAVFLDFDDGEAPPELAHSLPPTMRVQSVRGPHLYWVLSEQVEIEPWISAMQAVLARWGADPKGSGRGGADPHGQVLTGPHPKPASILPQQTMRLPGFDHCKAAGVRVRLQYARPDLRYSLQEIVDALGADAPVRAPVRKREAPTGDHPFSKNLERARAYLDRIEGSPEGGRHSLAVKVAPVGGDFGLSEEDFWPLFCDWNIRRNQPPLGERQLRQLLHDSYTYRTSPVGSRLDEPSDGFLAAQAKRKELEEERWAGIVDMTETFAPSHRRPRMPTPPPDDVPWPDDSFAPLSPVGMELATASTGAVKKKKKAGKIFEPPTVIRPGEMPDDDPDSDQSPMDDSAISGFVTKQGPDGLAMNEFGNMMRFIGEYGHRVRHCSTLGCWLYWDGKRWVEDRDSQEGEAYRACGAVRAIADTFFNNMQPMVQHLREESEKRGWLEFCHKSISETQVKAALDKASRRRNIAIAPTMLDRHHHLLNTAMGPVDLKTGTLMSPRWQLYLSKISEISSGASDRCPSWMAFLCRIFQTPEGQPDFDLINFIQRAVGYSMTGETGEQCLFLMFGTGANGKTTFLNVLLDILGEYGTQSDFSTFQEQQGERVRSDLARLHRARFVAANEPKQGKRLDEATIKGLTGQDKIVCRFLFQNEFTYVPTFKVWLSSNHQPEIRGTDEGIWRRIMMIPFTAFIAPEERDPNLPTKLHAERGGIFQWAIEGARLWYKHGLQPPDAVRAATSDYREEMDTLRGFIETKCVIGPDLAARSKPLYNAYKRWAGDSNVYVLPQPKFLRALKDRGFRLAKKNYGNEFCGIGLVDDPDKQDHSDPRVKD